MVVRIEGNTSVRVSTISDLETVEKEFQNPVFTGNWHGRSVWICEGKDHRSTNTPGDFVGRDHAIALLSESEEER